MTARPPLYRLLLLGRRLPKASSSENFEVAALFTLPLTRNPSEGSWLASSCGLGISGVLLFEASGGLFAVLAGSALGCGFDGRVGASFVSAIISSIGSRVSSHFAAGIFGVMVTSASMFSGEESSPSCTAGINDGQYLGGCAAECDSV